MNITKQIVDNQIMNLIKENPEYFADTTDDERKKSKSFLLLAVSAYLGTEVSDAVQYITDNPGDGGFDAAYIVVEQDSQIHVVLFQTKYTRDLEKESNFPANSIEKAVNTVKGVFDPQKQMELNENSRKAVTEIHSYLLDGYIPFVTFVCVNNGLAWNTEAQNHIDNSFKKQRQVKFEYFNHEDIINYTTKTKSIDDTIRFNGKAIREDFNYKSVILGRVCVSEIYRLMDRHGDALLEMNIRKFLGKNTVNEGIRSTLTDDGKRNNFFFYNNGITIVCRKFSANYLQENNWNVIIDNLQIINGGQTCKTIYQTMNENPNIDFSGVDILVRLYEVNSDEDVIRDITFATNSQSPVDFRDLRSNDEKQILLEQSAKELGYVYKRKKEAQTGNQVNLETIPSSVAAEAVLAVWEDAPHLAKHKKHEFFSTYYERIFSNLNAAQMIIAVLVFRYCDNNRRKHSNDPEVMAQRPFSQYFIAMVMGRQLLLKLDLLLKELTHRNFLQIFNVFEQKKDIIYQISESFLVDCLHEHMNSKLQEIDGRTIAAVFRRFDLVEKYIKNCPLLF
jgi:hypothetical protein